MNVCRQHALECYQQFTVAVLNCTFVSVLAGFADKRTLDAISSIREGRECVTANCRQGCNIQEYVGIRQCGDPRIIPQLRNLPYVCGQNVGWTYCVGRNVAWSVCGWT